MHLFICYFYFFSRVPLPSAVKCKQRSSSLTVKTPFGLHLFCLTIRWSWRRSKVCTVQGSCSGFICFDQYVLLSNPDEKSWRLLNSKELHFSQYGGKIAALTKCLSNMERRWRRTTGEQHRYLKLRHFLENVYEKLCGYRSPFQHVAVIFFALTDICDAWTIIFGCHGSVKSLREFHTS